MPHIIWMDGAALKGHLEVVKFLASLTENPNTRDKSGTTPSNEATRNGHDEIVQFLQSCNTN